MAKKAIRAQNAEMDPTVAMSLKRFSLWEYMAEAWNVTETFMDRPYEWITSKNEFLWSTQRRIAESVRDNRYTVVPSCHGAGKSFIASRIIAWWVESHPPGESFVVSTAPSAAQVMAILWREITRFHESAGLVGKINRAGYPKWYIGAQLIGYGRKPSDYTDTAFQGIHEKYVLVVLDEAAGITQHLFDSVDALATNESARVLAIGNPTDGGSHFANICKPNSGWNMIRIDGLRTPNMSKKEIVGDDPKNPKYPFLQMLMEAEDIPFSEEEVPPVVAENLISPLWIEERILRWGGLNAVNQDMYNRDEMLAIVRERCAASPLFMCKVRGLFPATGATNVIPLGWVQMAVDRWNDWKNSNNSETKKTNRISPNLDGRRVVGVDVARGGEDESCIAVRQGNCLESIQRFRNDDTIETANEAAVWLNHAQSIVVVDVIGIGAGVYDTLRNWSKSGRIQSETLAFNASAQSKRTDKIGEFKFRNDRAASWWKMRELLDPSSGSNIMLPDDESLMEELTAVKYEVFTGGIIKIETKDEIRKRIGRSTDTADAVNMTFWVDGLAYDQSEAASVNWVQPHRGDGVFRYDGNEGFQENDLFSDAGSSWDGGSSINYSEIYGSVENDWIATHGR